MKCLVAVVAVYSISVSAAVVSSVEANGTCLWASKCMNSEGQCHRCITVPSAGGVTDRCTCGPNSSDWIKPGECNNCTEVESTEPVVRKLPVPAYDIACFFVILGEGLVIAPWLWIGMRGSVASAWGSQSIDKPPIVARTLTPRFAAHLRGRTCWVYFLVFVLCLHCCYLIHHLCYVMTPLLVVVCYVLCLLPASMILAFAWCRIGRPNGVPFGLIALFGISSGLLGVVLSLIGEGLVMISWAVLSPNCHPILQLTDAPPPLTFGCQTKLAIMWIFTPGLIEESAKAIWLFYRLRRVPEEVPKKCCLCFPATRAYDCGCWYKLAPTPYHVILASLACGAGFELIENLGYVFMLFPKLAKQQHEDLTEMMLVSSFERSITSCMHMVWTCMVGIGLALRLFAPDGQRPYLFAVLAPPSILHGLFDYSLQALGALNTHQQTAADDSQQTGSVEYYAMLFFFLALFLLSSLGATIWTCRVTGLRCIRCGDCPFYGCICSACCSPGFWSEEFGYPGILDEMVQVSQLGQAVFVREPLLPGDGSSH